MTPNCWQLMQSNVVSGTDVELRSTVSNDLKEMMQATEMSRADDKLSFKVHNDSKLPIQLKERLL